MEIFTLLIYCSVCHHIHHYTVYPIIQSRWPSHMRLLYYIPKIWLVQSKNTLNFEVLVKNCSVSTFCWNDNTLLCVCAYLLSCIWHFANFLDCSPLGSSVHGIFQARILKWVAISSSWGSSRLRDPTCVSCVFCIEGRFFTCWATKEAVILYKLSKFWIVYSFFNMQNLCVFYSP